MKKNEKTYYTPDISEFSVGAIIEEYRNNKWNKLHTDSNTIGSILLEDANNKDFNISNFRIKYLDSDDIESLNLYFLKKGWGDKSKIFRHKDGIEIYFRNNKGSILITNHTGSVLFEGVIKNKMELVKYLKNNKLINL